MDLVTDEKIARKAPQSTLIGRVLSLAGGVWGASRGQSQKRMRIIEMLSLGAKKQLVLVSCDGECFLVGTGPEHVQTIVRLGSKLETPDSSAVAVVGECA
jgi:Flagellar biosynthesis protein, FliO